MFSHINSSDVNAEEKRNFSLVLFGRYKYNKWLIKENPEMTNSIWNVSNSSQHIGSDLGIIGGKMSHFINT